MGGFTARKDRCGLKKRLVAPQQVAAFLAVSFPARKKWFIVEAAMV
jgi:hypothetical protein